MRQSRKEIPSGSLYNQPDEDFLGGRSCSSTSNVVSAITTCSRSRKNVTGFTQSPYDEDFLGESGTPVQATLFQSLPLVDVENLPGYLVGRSPTIVPTLHGKSTITRAIGQTVQFSSNIGGKTDQSADSIHGDTRNAGLASVLNGNVPVIITTIKGRFSG